MGGVAGANLLVAGGIKGGNAVRSTLRKPQTVIPEANLKPNVAAETVQQTAKPLVHSEVVAPKYPQGYTTTFDTSLFTNESANLASPKRTIHILTGDETGGGHLFPGMPGKTPFPKDWSPSKIMNAASDVVTNPNNTWIQEKGILGTWTTKSGKPARGYVIGTIDGVEIKVIIEPRGNGIITAHPF
jgi:hypothetical protein